MDIAKDFLHIRQPCDMIDGINRAGDAVFGISGIQVIEQYKHNWEHVLTHGHAGHDYHGHGHGSENAGGGIVDAE